MAELVLRNHPKSAEDAHLSKITHVAGEERLSTLVTLNVPRPSSKGEQNLQNFVIDAFSRKMPALTKFTLQNQTATELAKQIMVSNSGSKATLYQYMYGVYRYCDYLGRAPDDLITDCLGPDGESLANRVSHHVKNLDRFVLELKAGNLAPGTISNHIKGVRALYRANGIKLELPYRLSRRVVYNDRAPTQEELAHILEVADLRGKAIASMLALSGFRVGTLVRLQYCHVREDLERGIMPIHVHVEAKITKGGYGEYDTFLGAEAAEYLRLYLEERRMGKRYGIGNSEEIRDDSPLIRDEHSLTVRPLTPGGVHRIIHNLLLKAGILESGSQPRYEVRPHSIRKFFRTQLAALGLNTDYIEYMMGHKISTYHNVQMLGIEKLRQVYLRSGLSIKPRTTLSKLETLKELTRSLGLDPEKVLVKDALAEPHRIVIDGKDENAAQFQALSQAIRNWIKQEVLTPPVR